MRAATSRSSQGVQGLPGQRMAPASITVYTEAVQAAPGALSVADGAFKCAFRVILEGEDKRQWLIDGSCSKRKPDQILGKSAHSVEGYNMGTGTREMGAPPFLVVSKNQLDTVLIDLT